MIERRDDELSRIYRDAEGPRPPQRVDDNILAASQRVAGARRRPAGFGFARRWGTPVALAATVLVTFTLALMVFERESGVDAMAPEARRTGRPAKVLPAEPQRADQLEKSSPAELQGAVAPAPPAAARGDRAEQRPSESAASTEGPGAGQPAFEPDTRTVENLRKREEAMPASAAAAPAANLYSRERAGVDQQPAAGAGGLLESASTVRSAGALASRVAAPEAKERTPEKWLEDIRKLKTEGKTAEAERELGEFRKRYPEYRLPEDLR